MSAPGVVFFALNSIRTGEAVVSPGEWVPGAENWKHIGASVTRGEVFPVLTCTLPQEMQDAITAHYVVTTLPESADIVVSVEEPEGQGEEQEEATTEADAEGEAEQPAVEEEPVEEPAKEEAAAPQSNRGSKSNRNR